ncbi:MAG: hypothetical protein WCA35_25280 [Kovacikia sp.]
MKKLIYIAPLIMAVLLPIPVVAATGRHCQGNAIYGTPPVVNNVTHIWNVVWKNTRAMCLHEMSQNMLKQTTSSKPQETIPTLKPIQLQKPQRDN